MGGYVELALIAAQVTQTGYSIYKNNESGKTEEEVLKAKEKANELQAEELQNQNLDKTINLIKSNEAMQASTGFDLSSGTFKAITMDTMKTMRENSDKINLNKDLKDLDISMEKAAIKNREASSLISGVGSLGESAFMLFSK